MSVGIFGEPEAESQLLELDDWWRMNRPAAADQVLNEFERIEMELSESPEVGRRYGDYAHIRWVKLNKTPCLLFYEYEPGSDQLWIVSIWGGKRGAGRAGDPSRTECSRGCLPPAHGHKARSVSEPAPLQLEVHRFCRTSQEFGDFLIRKPERNKLREQVALVFGPRLTLAIELSCREFAKPLL